MPATLFDKIWDPHVVADLGAGWSLLYCGRVLVHDSPIVFGDRPRGELAPSPALGRDTRAVLADVLGMEAARIEALAAQGAFSGDEAG